VYRGCNAFAQKLRVRNNVKAGRSRAVLLRNTPTLYAISIFLAKADKLLTRMRRNPAGDWTILDIERLCGGLGWQCLPPTGGASHRKITAADDEAILTIPAKRPVKPVYIRKVLAI
jgi:hypothetical protein